MKTTASEKEARLQVLVEHFERGASRYCKGAKTPEDVRAGIMRAADETSGANIGKEEWLGAHRVVGRPHVVGSGPGRCSYAFLPVAVADGQDLSRLYYFLYGEQAVHRHMVHFRLPAD